MNTPEFTGNQVLAWLVGTGFCGILLGLAIGICLGDIGILAKNFHGSIAPTQNITQVKL